MVQQYFEIWVNNLNLEMIILAVEKLKIEITISKKVKNAFFFTIIYSYIKNKF